MRISKLPFLILAAALACVAHAGVYRQFEIVAPRTGATVHNNSGQVGVAIEIAPPLDTRGGDRFVLTLDGKPVAHGTSSHLTLTGVDRGSHALTARVEAVDGSVLATSPTIDFQMWRASRLFPNRAH